MLFCEKPKKTGMAFTPAEAIVTALAVTGAVSIVMMIRKRGKTAKRAISRAGCICKDAAVDAANEIFGDCGCDKNED